MPRRASVNLADDEAYSATGIILCRTAVSREIRSSATPFLVTRSHSLNPLSIFTTRSARTHPRSSRRIPPHVFADMTRPISTFRSLLPLTTTALVSDVSYPDQIPDGSPYKVSFSPLSAKAILTHKPSLDLRFYPRVLRP
jgi:hypothetical protein